MRRHGNTIFITGGSSGIGKALGEAFYKLGNTVIITGRREGRLKSICEANPGMSYFVLDVRDADAIRRVGAAAMEQFPQINVVFNNAGVQMAHDFSADAPLDEAALIEEIETNVLGVIRIANTFLPCLKEKENAVLVNVSSGLAFVPLARFPIYCATKAAVHSLTLSMRHQLKGSGVRVIELIPPYVETELGGIQKIATERADAPRPMQLEAFVQETIKELEGGGEEAAIAGAKPLVAATTSDSMKQIFLGMNR